MIQTLEIQNFKSVKHAMLDCRRVNVFIGEPNTGKSNILESLGLFSVPHTGEIRDFVRMENMSDLFYERDLSQEIAVKCQEACTGEGHRAPTGEGHRAPTGEGHRAPTGERHLAPTGEGHLAPTSLTLRVQEETLQFVLRARGRRFAIKMPVPGEPFSEVEGWFNYDGSIAKGGGIGSTPFKFYRFSPGVVFSRKPAGFLLPPGERICPRFS